jgi:hypothetical protein
MNGYTLGRIAGVLRRAIPSLAKPTADRPVLCRADHWRRGDPLRSLGSAAAARAAGGHALGCRLLLVGPIMIVGLITLVEVFIAYLVLCAAWDVAHGLDNGAVWVLLWGTVLTVWFDRRRRMLIAHWKFSRNRPRAPGRAYDEHGSGGLARPLPPNADRQLEIQRQPAPRSGARLR